MFQLFARINDVATFAYNKKVHCWQNTKFFPVIPEAEVGLKEFNDVIEAFAEIEYIFGPVPAKIEYRKICLN